MSAVCKIQFGGQFVDKMSITKKTQPLDLQVAEFQIGDPGEARTLDPLIKSQLLYQLSYGVKYLGVRSKPSLWLGIFLKCDAKVGTIFELSKYCGLFSKKIYGDS